MKLKCECKLCKTCLIRKLKVATNDKIYLNAYEKSKIFLYKEHLKLQPTKCFCSGNFDVDIAINLISNDLVEYLKKSHERLAVMACKYCLFCEASVVNNQEKSPQILRVKVLDQAYNFNHVVCLKCHEKNKNIRLDSIQCQICDSIHQIDINIWEKHIKLENDSCSSCCLIF